MRAQKGVAEISKLNGLERNVVSRYVFDEICESCFAVGLPGTPVASELDLQVSAQPNLLL